MTTKVMIRCLTVGSLAIANLSMAMVPVQAQKPTSNPESVNWALLTKTQVKELQALNIRIVAPQVIPKGYAVYKVVSEPCPNNQPCRFGPRYSIIYRNEAQDSCFTVEGVGGGIGGPPSLENSVRVLAGVLGTTDLHYGRYSMPEMRFTYPNELLYMNFTASNVGQAPFYRVVGSVFTRQMYLQNLSSNDNEERPKMCRNEVSLSEIVPVIQSLKWLE